jgi:BirA family transcriptional regulator, biotin operon repressor / biotin---[acetyl-CoA-carboxylase] ligase
MKDFAHSLFDDFFWYPKLNSTSKQALKLIQDKAVHGNFLIIADNQTNGYGRKGTPWISPIGGIWMTAGFYGLPEQSSFTILIGNCIHKALLHVSPELVEHLLLKWPNDIMYNDFKLAGILTDNYPALNYTLVGVGIDTNVNEFPSSLQQIATSLNLILGHETDNRKILSQIYDEIENALPSYLEEGILKQINYHNHHSYLKNKMVEINTDFGSYSGLCLGINKEGALILRLKSGMIQPFFSGSLIVLSKAI